MAVLLSDVYDEVRALLHDQTQRFTDALLLPLAKKAYAEWQNHLVNNGLSVLHETSAALTVLANATEFQAADTGPAGALSGMILPLHLEERTVGDGDDRWIPMRKTSWEPSALRTQNLGVWTWREGKVQFLGATQNREVKVRFRRTLSVLVNGASTVEFGDSGKPFLASRTAALAAWYIGENPSRAQTLNDDANMQITLAVNVAVKHSQSIGTRRRPFGSRRYRRR